MTHFNHEWDTTKTPAVPVSVKDRYYAQDLNDDFNYLKHLPYEVFLQNRSRGVMVSPNDTWENNTNSLTLSGGFGTVLQDCIELDPNEDFTIPPKTHSSPRYERIPFINTTLVLPNDNTTHYIVATPTKRSLLQRTKTLFTEQYASRVRYDGIITIQDTAPTTGQILVGLCHNKEYCLLTDIDPNQCKDNIILKKWFGQNKITQDFVSILQSYYNTSIASIETKISINTVSGIINAISDGTLNNCSISIDTVSGGAVSGGAVSDGTLNNCSISIGTVSNGRAIYGGTLNNCIISINTANNVGRVIGGGTLNNCSISIDTMSGSASATSDDGTLNNCSISIGTVSNNGIYGGTLNNCSISIDTMSSGGYGVRGGTLNNCDISIGTVDSNFGGVYGIYGGTFSNCSISIDTVNNGYAIYDGTFNSCSVSIGTFNDDYGIYGGTFSNCSISIDTVNDINYVIGGTTVKMYLTHIECSAITSLNGTGGKLNVLNDTVFHTS